MQKTKHAFIILRWSIVIIHENNKCVIIMIINKSNEFKNFFVIKKQWIEYKIWKLNINV